MPITAQSALESILDQRILILDGAMGTMLQTYGLTDQDFHGTRFASHPVPLKGFNDLLAITRPDIIEEVHRAYLEAGADIIETNTFNATQIGMADYGMEHLVKELNQAAVAVARRAADAYTAPLCRGFHWADHQNSLDLAQRFRPGLSRGHVRRTGRNLRRTDSGAG